MLFVLRFCFGDQEQAPLLALVILITFEDRFAVKHFLQLLQLRLSLFILIIKSVSAVRPRNFSSPSFRFGDRK